jgi:cellobiose phosphorylase
MARQFLEDLLSTLTHVTIGQDPDPDGETHRWLQALTHQTRTQLNELLLLAPWLSLPHPPSGSAAMHLPEEMETILSLHELTGIELAWLPEINHRLTWEITPEERQWLTQFKDAIAAGAKAARLQVDTLNALGEQCLDGASIEYDFLYDPTQKLLSIGYNVEEHRRDNGFYDLLASESRLGIFVGIAEGKLPQEAWFALGRQLTNASGTSILVSWSGSMFEYLMPLLVMPEYENTLLDQTNKAMVQRQIEYGKQRDVNWGISESGYNMVDAQLNYQYRAFGVPGLGLKRGLAEDLVIAPYSSVMALMVAPEKACENLTQLTAEGFEGKFGYYEAIDYTPSRLPRGQSSVIIRSFMVHHQGMSLLSLAYLLLNRPMQKRFEAELSFQATLLLLQERIPKATGFYSPPADIPAPAVATGDTVMRVINTPDTPTPEVQLLSNGRYHVMVTNAGSGYSRWKDIAITRWREDGTCDSWGSFCYIRDLENTAYWSAGHQPTLRAAKSYEAVFSQGRAEFRRRDTDIETHTEIVVSPEDDIEMRRIRLTNRSRKRRTLEVTSYAEIVLNSAIADALHPAFNNLFVETEIIADRQSILCTRRPRSTTEQCPWMFHLMKVHGADVSEVSYETDRMQFIGRGNTLSDPQSMNQGTLSGTQGSVLDPIVAIRYRITLNPQEAITIDMVYGAADSREASLGLIEKYHDQYLTDRAFELAWTHSQVVLRQINATEADAQLYARLAGSIIYANPFLRADPAILIRNRRGQSGLWSYSISGDLPIVLVQIEDPANIDLVRQMIQAHAYWRLKGLIVDLVIWNEDHGGYRQLLQNQLLGLISAGVETDMADRPGGIFVRVSDQIAPEDRILLQTVARVIISDNGGELSYQVSKRNMSKPVTPRLVPRQLYFPQTDNTSHTHTPADLLFFNGLGGFTSDGQEYVIITSRGQATPAPWVNVLANPNFGMVISESGQSYTWVENAHEFRLTPWNNDPVIDPAGEAFYIRDEESGIFWSPAPLPARGKTPYTTRHGFGYTIFEHSEEGIHSEMQVYVDLDAPVQFRTIKLQNHSGRERRLSITGYIEWVLGDLRPKSSMHIVTEIDPVTGALLAKNPYNTEFGGRVCFFDVNETTRTYTGDRTEFIGRNGTLRSPEALTKIRLMGRSGAALDPCGALQATIELADGQELEIVFLLGAGKDATEASNMVLQFRGGETARNALDKVRSYWQQTLGAIRIDTPEPSLNVLANGWLVYQTLACRIRGRSGFYQSGGAFGFRDQLQDSLAILHSEPTLVRNHLLLSASRQFREGDVQHWWHPPTGRGVRTRCSDDFLWLPFVTSRYVIHTGDLSILDETASFLEGRPLNTDEESYYDLPGHSGQSGSLYEHCILAIRHGFRYGEHGLPLMGSGDWNDGMDQVGIHGKGESIWLGFFLYSVLVRFSEIAILHKDEVFAIECRRAAATLKDNLDKHGWDGQWYRRAYFDDGTPLGSSTNPECRIDSIAQSWSVLSGAGDPEHARQGMEAADKYLVRRDLSLIQLLDPPFDKSDLNPGYIKGYVPGVRENGGQYTHAAIWLTMAFAARKDRSRTWELFNMINPVNHGNSTETIATYKAEPYVVAADVYSIALHKGRGGWTWYTGSAGWMYQLITGSILGLIREGDHLSFSPCTPIAWDNFRIDYRYKDTVYHIQFHQIPATTQSQIQDTSITQAPAPEVSVSLDSTQQPTNRILLVDDHVAHTVEVRIGHP